MEQFMLPCISKLFFNIPCPGCGIQRAILLLSKGEFLDAFFMYPAIFPLIIFGLLIISRPFLKLKNYGKMLNISSILSVVVILINYGIELSIHFQS